MTNVVSAHDFAPQAWTPCQGMTLVMPTVPQNRLGFSR
jgi:hypothetical protein